MINLEKVSQEFATDLIELVNNLKGIEYDGKVNYKTKSGAGMQFEYVTLDRIYSIVKANNNFAVLEPLGTTEFGDNALKVVLVHKSGEIISSDYYKVKTEGCTSKQDEGAAITYTKRYALGSFLGLCTDEDNDANPQGEGMPLSSQPMKQTTKPSSTQQEDNLVCSECGTVINKAVATVSEHKFGKCLCPLCQLKEG